MSSRNSFMKELKKKHCRVCNKVFCCQKCREKHEVKVHNIHVECNICIYGCAVVSINSSSSLLKHLESNHLPLICNFCQTIFKTTDDIMQHNKCPVGPYSRQQFCEEMPPITPVRPSDNSAYDSPPIMGLFQKEISTNTYSTRLLKNLATSTPVPSNVEKDFAGMLEVVTPIDSAEGKDNKTQFENKGEKLEKKRHVTFLETPQTEYEIRNSNISSSTGTFYTAKDITTDPSSILKNKDKVTYEKKGAGQDTNPQTDTPAQQVNKKNFMKQQNLLKNSTDSDKKDMDTDSRDTRKVDTMEDSLNGESMNSQRGSTETPFRKIKKNISDTDHATKNDDMAKKNEPSSPTSPKHDHQFVVPGPECISAKRRALKKRDGNQANSNIHREQLFSVNHLTPVRVAKQKVDIALLQVETPPMFTADNSPIGLNDFNHCQYSSTKVESSIEMIKIKLSQEFNAASGQGLVDKTNFIQQAVSTNYVRSDDTYNAASSVYFQGATTKSDSTNTENDYDSLKNNNATGLWTSVTNLVKNMMIGIASTTSSFNNNSSSLSMKRSLCENDDTVSDEPRLKRYKLSDIKCRRPIREYRGEYPALPSPKARFVDKWTQTD